MPDPYAWLAPALETIHQAHWYRTPQTITQTSGPVVEIGGQSWVNFASNDYLGLTSHPQMQASAIQAITSYGTGSTGSRLLSGQRPLHQRLEATLAEFKQTEAALVFSSGYLANLGTITALVGKRDLILGDAYNHSSLKNGAILSGAHSQDYAHGDMDNLHKLLSNQRHQFRRCLIVTDSVFSMDGDLCPLPDLLELGEKFNCMVLVDEAHATGVLGRTGAGCVEHFNCSGAPLIQMGTLSKALASLGGYVAGTALLIDFLLNRAPTWIYTTGLSPADTAAALEALKLVQQTPQRRQQLWENVALLKQLLQALPQLQRTDSPYRLLPSESAIVCLQMPDAKTVLAVSQALKNAGFWVPAIRPPTVPTSRLRFSLMASHQAEQIQQVVQVLAKVLDADGNDWNNR